jgi:hypothetical protein
MLLMHSESVSSLSFKPARRAEEKGARMTMYNSNAEHRDSVLAAFLRLIKKDLAEGQALLELPVGVAAAMRRALKVRTRLDEALDGNVAL